MRHPRIPVSTISDPTPVASGSSRPIEVPSTPVAAVSHPDGSHRLLYSLESPESWFEDFGEARLVDGKAEVRLDPDFAADLEEIIKSRKPRNISTWE